MRIYCHIEICKMTFSQGWGKVTKSSSYQMQAVHKTVIEQENDADRLKDQKQTNSKRQI